MPHSQFRQHGLGALLLPGLVLFFVFWFFRTETQGPGSPAASRTNGNPHPVATPVGANSHHLPIRGREAPDTESQEKAAETVSSLKKNVMLQLQALELKRSRLVSDYSRAGHRAILYVTRKPAPEEIAALELQLKKAGQNCPAECKDEFEKYLSEMRLEFFDFHGMERRFISVLVPENTKASVSVEDGFFNDESELVVSAEYTMPPNNQQFVRSLNFRKISSANRYGRLLSTTDD